MALSPITSGFRNWRVMPQCRKQSPFSNGCAMIVSSSSACVSWPSRARVTTANWFLSRKHWVSWTTAKCVSSARMTTTRWHHAKSLTSSTAMNRWSWPRQIRFRWSIAGLILIMSAWRFLVRKVKPSANFVSSDCSPPLPTRARSRVFLSFAPKPTQLSSISALTAKTIRARHLSMCLKSIHAMSFSRSIRKAWRPMPNWSWHWVSVRVCVLFRALIALAASQLCWSTSRVTVMTRSCVRRSVVISSRFTVVTASNSIRFFCKTAWPVCSSSSAVMSARRHMWIAKNWRRKCVPSCALGKTRCAKARIVRMRRLSH